MLVLKMPYKDRQKNLECMREWHVMHRAEENAVSRAYAAAHREEARERARLWRLANRARADANYARWRLENPEYEHVRILKRRGLTVEQYERMVVSQGGVCAICAEKQRPQRTRWAVTERLTIDHCHKTGRVRGLLCHRCNMSIGKFNDDSVLLRKAAEYLERHVAEAVGA